MYFGQDGRNSMSAPSVTWEFLATSSQLTPCIPTWKKIWRSWPSMGGSNFNNDTSTAYAAIAVRFHDTSIKWNQLVKTKKYIHIYTYTGVPLSYHNIYYCHKHCNNQKNRGFMKVQQWHIYHRFIDILSTIHVSIGVSTHTYNFQQNCFHRFHRCFPLFSLRLQSSSLFFYKFMK